MKIVAENWDFSSLIYGYALLLIVPHLIAILGSYCAKQRTPGFRVIGAVLGGMAALCGILGIAVSAIWLMNSMRLKGNTPYLGYSLAMLYGGIVTWLGMRAVSKASQSTENDPRRGHPPDSEPPSHQVR